MLRVGIIGCGKIADDHLQQIRRIAGCEVVGACDRELLMARQVCDRFGIEGVYDDVAALLQNSRPDVVHITTPPQSHFAIGRQCLEAGSHVYVEKPFTLNTRDAETLVLTAKQVGRSLTVGHDLQFSHVARRLRQTVKDGYLGGPPVHMESYYCYDLGSAKYAKALLGDRQHWVRKLPGQLLQNVISHGIARIAEHIVTDRPRVVAHGFTSPALRRFGETDLIDELRVTLFDRQEATAYFTFSSQMRPSLNLFRIYGPKNGLILDQDHETLIRARGGRFKSYAQKFLPQLLTAKQYAANSARNVRLFLARDFHMKAGMKNLIEAFYQSIEKNAPPPIPYREILLTSRIMDDIFGQLLIARRERRQTVELRESKGQGGHSAGVVH